MSRLVALVYQWESQCCGDPLVVGSEVDLTLTQQADDPLPGPDGRSVEWLVEHHGPDGPLRHVHGRVVALWEWRVRRECRGEPPAWYPVTGSDVFTPIDCMEVWDEQWQTSRTGAQPAGWAVELELLTSPEPDSPAAPTADRP